MLACLDWLKPKRRRADSMRREPTLIGARPLPPIDGMVRLRLRYNDVVAIALTDSEAAIHGVDIADQWADAAGDAPCREVVVEVPIPRWSEPGSGPIRAEFDRRGLPARAESQPTPLPGPRPPCGDVDAAAAGADATSTPPERAPMQPTPPPAELAPINAATPLLSPEEHAARLLAWCRRHGLVGDVIIADMSRAYARMCADDGIRPRPWNPVSRELTLLIHGQVGVKHYAWSHEADGAHKRRVFRIPAGPTPPAPSAMQVAA